jgi:hypothetical protein
VDSSPAAEVERDEEMMSMSLDKHVTARAPQQEMDDDADNWISLDDVQGIKEETVSTPHPFSGYPLASEVKLDKAMVSKTFIILLNPTFEQPEDPSNRNVSIFKDKDGRAGMGGKPGSNTVEKIVKLKTSHTRCVPDRFGVNHTVVFDRDVMVRAGKNIQIHQGAVVTSHSVRAQLMFYYDPDRKRTRTDKRYKLVDIKQQKRLLRLFESIHYQQTKAEYKARELERIPETTADDK